MKEEKKSEILLSAFLINVISFVVLLLLFCPRFESELDIIMQAVLYGVNGTYGSHLLFSNILLGKVLNICMQLLPEIPWYIVFHYFMTYVALILITYVTLKRNNNIMGRVITGLFVTFMGYECYICPNYIKTAALLASAAIYLLFYCIETNKRWLAVVAMMLAVLSSLICFEVFGLVSTIGMIGLVVILLRRESAFTWLRKNWIILVLTICFAVSLHDFDTQFYNSDVRWTSAEASRDSLQKILGFGFPEYDEMLQHEIGIEENDYNLLVQGVFASVGDNALSYMDEIASITREVNFETVVRFFRTMPIKAFKTGMFYCWIVLTIMLLLSETNKKKTVCGISIILLSLSYLLLYVLNAHSYEWVDMVIFLPICILVMTCIENVSVAEKEHVWIYMGVLGVTLYSIFSASLSKTTRTAEELPIWVQEVTMNQNNLYVVDLNSMLEQYSVFSVYPKGIAQIPNLRVIDGVYENLYGFEAASDIANVQEGNYYEMYLYVTSDTNADRLVTSMENLYFGKNVDYFWLENSYGMTKYQMYVNEAW